MILLMASRKSQETSLAATARKHMKKKQHVVSFFFFIIASCYNCLRQVRKEPRDSSSSYTSRGDEDQKTPITECND